MKNLDDWQIKLKEYANSGGNILLGKGRKIGATWIMAQCAVDRLYNTPNVNPVSDIVNVSQTEDQAHLLIAFAIAYALEAYPKNVVKKGRYKYTTSRVTLKVDKEYRTLLSRPVGPAGDAVRGFEGHTLMVDEAPKMPKLFWDSATPILATTGGCIWMWGTFFGKDNYFYKQYEKCYKRDDGRFKVFMHTTEEVFENRPISDTWTEEQRARSLKFLQDEKEDKSALYYAQEYLAVAAEDLRQLYPDDLIHDMLSLKTKHPKVIAENYLGVDVASTGKDEFVQFGLRKIDDNYVEQLFYSIDKSRDEKLLIPQGARLVIESHLKYNFKKIWVDDAGIGLGVFHLLLENKTTKSKVESMNNRSRPLDYLGTKTKKIMKEYLYVNLLSLMQQHKIKLYWDDKVKASLKSVQYETKPDGTMFIYGDYTHITEALVRAALCMTERKKEFWIR